MNVFFLFIFILSFSKASSENYKIIKITDLNNPWGSSFLNNNEIIITEKSGLIKIVNIINNQVINDDKLIISEKLFEKDTIKLSLGKKRHIKVEIN